MQREGVADESPNRRRLCPLLSRRRGKELTAGPRSGSCSGTRTGEHEDDGACGQLTGTEHRYWACPRVQTGQEEPDPEDSGLLMHQER